MKHYEETIFVPASPETVFAFADGHRNFSAHMNKSSWMMGGGKMDTTVDEGRGQQIGSHIRMSGKAFGMAVSLDEVVTEHQPPFLKAWKTVGTPKLVVVGNYAMKFTISPRQGGSQLTVSIDYYPPQAHVWLGKLFGPMFVKWCVNKMTEGVKNRFA